MKKNIILKIIISLIFTILIMFLVNSNLSFAATHYYTTYADLGYKELINATMNYCPQCKGTLTNDLFYDPPPVGKHKASDRQFHCQTACIHRASSAERDNKIVGIIDINKNGNGYNHATFIDKYGEEHDLGYNDAWAKLAFVSYRAEAKGQLENNELTYKEDNEKINTTYSYSFVYAFGYIWQKEGLRDACHAAINDAYTLPVTTDNDQLYSIEIAANNYLFKNSAVPDFDAEQYIADGGVLRGYNPKDGKKDGKDTGQTIRARILIFDSDTTQAVAIMSAAPYNISTGVSVEKTITKKSHYQHRGNAVDFKITITNETSSAVNLDLTDTYKTTEYELISIDGVAAREEDKDGCFVRNLTINGMAGTSPTKKEIIVKMRILPDAPAIKDHTEKDIKLINTVTISDFQDPTTGEKLENSSTKTSDWDYYVALIYKVSINRYITRVDNYYYKANDVYTRMTDKSETVYAETGQRVVLCIRLKNEGVTQSTDDNEKVYNYGTLYNIEVADLWSNRAYVDTPKYWDSESGTWNDTLPEGHDWSLLPNGSGFKLSKLAVGRASYLYVSYRVVQKSITPEEVIASAKITKIKAGSHASALTIYDTNVDVIARDKSTKYMAYIIPESSDKFTIKAYKVNITKTADKSIVDMGENITFTITVTNSASGKAYGNFHEIILEEIYDSDDFDFVSDSKSSLWTRNGTTYTYKTDPDDSTQTGLAPRRV